jgi:hypothetical protein
VRRGGVADDRAGRQPGAGGRGRLRASHADRERAVGVLQDAFVQGRLNKDELDARVGQAFASRTYAELATLTADIPSRPCAVPAPPRQPVPAQHRAPGNRTARDVAIGLVIGLVLAAVIVFGGLLEYGAFGVLVIPVVAVLPLVLIANAAERRHSRRQLPPRPERAQALESQPDLGAVGRDSARPGGYPDRTRPSRPDPTCSDPTRSDPTRSDPTRSDPTRSDPTREEQARQDPARQDQVCPDLRTHGPARGARGRCYRPPPR